MSIAYSELLTQQRIKMEQDSKEKNKNFQKKINAKINNLQDVIEENTKRLKEE